MHDARCGPLRLLAILILVLFATIPAAASSPIVVASSTATSEFPQALQFRLTATSGAADITKVELRFKMRGSDSTTVARPEFTPGRQIEASYRWKTDKSTLPPGLPVEFTWTIADKADNTLTTDPQTVVYEDLRFPWRHRKNDDIAFYWYEGSDDFGTYVFDVAVRALTRISADIGAEVKYPIRIYAYADKEDFRSAFPALGDTRQWIGGMAFSAQAITVQILPDEGGRTIWIHDVIPHEISHLVFYQATDHPPADPPRWLNEGLAQHNEETDHSYQIALVEDAAENGELFPLKILGGGFFEDSEKTRLAYAESYHAVEYIFATYGREGMARLIAAFGAGKTRDVAFQEAFGISLDELDRQWQRSLGVTPATATPVPSPSPTLVRPWMNPTAVPWGKKTPSSSDATVTPGTQLASALTPTPVPPKSTPVPAPGVTAPSWLVVIGVACCCASAVLTVAFLVGLVWLVKR